MLEACDRQGYGNITLCPETMGKINQLGDLDEVLECVPWMSGSSLHRLGHLYARSLGELEGEQACREMLDKVEQALGEERASRFHSHFSRIELPPTAERSATAPLPTTEGLARTGRPWPERWPAGAGVPPSSAKAQAPRRRTR